MNSIHLAETSESPFKSYQLNAVQRWLNNHPDWLCMSFGTRRFPSSFEFEIRFWWEMIEQPCDYSI